jgi:recombinational DNA repair ATPase RecF
VFRQETGSVPVALLDDLDSELDDERAGALCREMASNGQALVTIVDLVWGTTLGGLVAWLSAVAGRGLLRL